MFFLKRIHYFFGILSLSIITGCQPPVLNEETKDKYNDFIIARADNNYSLSAKDLYDRIGNSTILSKGGYLDQTTIKKILDSLVVDSLTGFEADKINLRDYFYDHWNYRLRYHDYLMQVFLYEKVFSQVSADSLEIVEYYNKRPDLYTVEEQLDLYHIFISKTGLKNSADSVYYKSLSEEEMNKVHEDYTRKIYQILTFGEPFQNVAFRYSHDEISRRGSGAVGWTTRGIYIDPFDSVAFSLKPGQYSEPYQDKDGWHIIYMNDYLPAGVIPLERTGVFESARQNLLQEKSGRLNKLIMDSLMQNLNVLANEAIMDTDIYLVDDSVWGGIVNGIDTIDAKEIKNYEHAYRKRYLIKNTDRDMKKVMLNEIGQRYVVLQAARREGLDTIPRVVEERERLWHLAAKSVVEKNKFDVSWKPSEEAVKAYYDERRDQYIVEKPLYVKYLTVSDSLYAEFLRDQVLAGMAFEDIVNADFAKNMKIKIVDLGYVGQGDVDSVFYHVALGTPTASVSSVYKTDRGFHLLKVKDKKQSVDYHLARGQIITQLKQDYRIQKLQEFQDRVFGEYHVEFPRILKTLHLKPYQYRIR